MSNPGELPTSPTPKKRFSCWQATGVGCLILFLAGLVILAFVFTSLLHRKDFRKALIASELAPPAALNMSDIRGALVRYQLKKGDYPASLRELVPDYLPDKSKLHSALDTNPNPDHISFTYVRPTSTSPPSTKILSLSYGFSLTVGGKTQKTVFILTETLGGKGTESEYINGKYSASADYPADDDQQP